MASTRTSTGRTRKLSTSGRDRGTSLADFLAERLAVDPAAAAALVRGGGVYVGRSRVEAPDRVLDAGEHVTVHGSEPEPEPAEGAAGSADAAPDAPFAIAYETRDLLVVEKPAGMPTQATRASVRGVLDRLVQVRDPAARLLHRLDRDASGLVMFTRSTRARARFAAMLADGRVARRYVAVVRGHLQPDQGKFDRPIGVDPRDRRRMAATGATGEVGQGWRPALTHYRVVRRGQDPRGAPTSLVELDLATGRTHQIRVHLATAGYPLVGDRLYGGEAGSDGPRLCLHSARLAWPDREVLSPAPDEFAALVA